MLKATYNKTNKKKVWAFFAVLATVVIAEIVLTAAIPQWRSYFYDVLQAKDAGSFHTAILYFVGLVGGLGAVQGLKVWVGRLVSFQFREAASKLLLKTWVSDNKKVSNYTQAQTEALRNATEIYLEISVEVFISISIVIMLIAANIHNTPILIAAVVYTVLISILAALFNKPLIQTNTAWQESEGVYREALGDIANGNGDYSSKTKFKVLVSAYYHYIRTAMYFTLFSSVKSSLASVVPYLLLGGAYFAGTIALGGFMAGVSTFELLTVNASILIILYPKLAQARASYAIVKNFYKEIK